MHCIRHFKAKYIFNYTWFSPTEPAWFFLLIKKFPVPPLKKNIAQPDLHIRNGALNKYTIYRYLVAEHSNHYKNLIMMN